MRPAHGAKILVFGLLALIPVALAAGLALAEKRRAPGWGPVLQAYLAAQARATGDEWRALQVVAAGRPWEFTPQISGRVFGDDPLFRTDFGSAGTTPFPPGAYDLGQVRRNAERKPLPYPPQALWCAFLERQPPGGTKQFPGVFLAGHGDLYNATFGVHEALPDLPTPLLEDQFRQAGCNW